MLQESLTVHHLGELLFFQYMDLQTKAHVRDLTDFRNSNSVSRTH